jgi:tRNA A37 threonylcarbamoyladenosine biosynthesis protein TsaE
LDSFATALADRIRAIDRRPERTLVVIDGAGGAGKTTLAKDIHEQLAPRADIVMAGADLPLFKLAPQLRAAGGG